MPAGKRFREAAKGVIENSYSLEQAVALVKKTATARFDETVELVVNLGVDSRRSDQMVRGVCELPHGTGRTVRVCVFVADEGAEEARKAGADVVGAEEFGTKGGEGGD